MGSRTTAWDRLGDYLHQTKIIGSIESTLYWDQNTRMPSGGASWRGEQLALLAIQLHSRQSSREYAELIQEARVEWNQSDLSRTEQAACGRNLDLLEQDLARQQALDPALVAALATAKADGYNNWQQARADSDFGLFAPSLRTMIGLRQEQARQLAEPRSCWETLAQPFEPDLTLERLQALFAPLRQRLPELLQRAGGQPRQRELSWDLPEPAQQQLCDRLLTSWGRDASITCVARSPPSLLDHAWSKRLQDHDKSCSRTTALLFLGHSP
jgi:carboxypeptidase Taq